VDTFEALHNHLVPHVTLLQQFAVAKDEQMTTLRQPAMNDMLFGSRKRYIDALLIADESHHLCTHT
jgi:hypothetical protein